MRRAARPIDKPRGSHRDRGSEPSGSAWSFLDVNIFTPHGNSVTLSHTFVAQAVSDVLVIVPTYNERENLPAIIEAVHRELASADVLVVDDASPDGTGALADQIAARVAKVKVLHREGKLGLGTAYVAGFKHALASDYEFVFEMDCDFSHDPKYLPILLERVRSGSADVALGSRYVSGGGDRKSTRLNSSH